LVISDGEIRLGRVGDATDRRGVWPRSQVVKVVVERMGTEPRAVERGRRSPPFYVVRILGPDGASHTARFTMRSKETAEALAAAIASRIGVAVEGAGEAPGKPRHGFG
jgi:hypothetical protein